MTVREPLTVGAEQYLTFMLNDETYAIEITRVREVLDNTRVTRMPRMSSFIKGVINLRGGVVPVVDLRLKFGMPAGEETVDTCIVINEIIVGNEPLRIGALVDSVKEVIELDHQQIAPPPRIGIRLDNDFIKSMGKQDDKFLIILDIEKIFAGTELSMVNIDTDGYHYPQNQRHYPPS
ncbi:MAG: purine-binding chemotaxis protein CheW [bacterium]|nr:purine-binding chemotaxis protein CheW [bacterium]